MNAACCSGSSLRDTVFGLRCSIPSRCNSATRPHRLSYSMPNAISIQAPTSRVVRGSVAVIQAFSVSCCSSLSRQTPPSWRKLAKPLSPSSSYRRYQLRIVSSSSSRTFATVSQLMPSSSRTSAFARRARRCAADPSRASSISSLRDFGLRNPRWIMPTRRIQIAPFRKGDFRLLAESGYNSARERSGFINQVLAVVEYQEQLAAAERLADTLLDGLALLLSHTERRRGGAK